MGESEQYPSYMACVANALSASSQPLSIDALVAQVGRQRPTGGGARGAVYRAIKQLYQAVPVAPREVGWLSHLLRDNTIRHPLTPDEVRRGYLLLDELEHAVFFPEFFQNQSGDDRTLAVELFGGPSVVAQAAIQRKTWSLQLGRPFVAWLDDQGGEGRDDLVITVRDAVAGEYGFRLQPHEVRDEEIVRGRNVQLALAAEEIMSSLRSDEKALPAWELVALLVGHGLFAEPVPPDDLHLVLQHFSMLRYREDVGFVLTENVPAGPRRRPNTSGSALAMEERFYGPVAWDGDDAAPDDEDEAPLAGGSGGDDDEPCDDYAGYLEHHHMMNPQRAPLSHGDYHLLEAELESLLGLEQEFGYLLPEQLQRVDELAERLYLDPDTLRADLADFDEFDDPDLDEPPFWQN
jgi:hypothetical protein